ncbi:MAG TPA: hypothetical protein GX401_06595 [Clostridiales bacterium]|nr:hypothetical protein [Clostridiales bacterium]
MEFYMKLPRNKKEFTVFMLVISFISVNIIAPLITCFEIGFQLSAWVETIKVIPFIWLCVIALVLLTYKPVELMKGKIVAKDDSFNAHIIVDTLCTVLLMSMCMTVIGSWIGQRAVTLEPIQLFFYKWPRNFAIAFGVETFIAQPIARFIMLKMHQLQDKKLVSVESEAV